MAPIPKSPALSPPPQRKCTPFGVKRKVVPCWAAQGTDRTPAVRSAHEPRALHELYMSCMLCTLCCASQGGGEGADWLEMEKRVVVIHRLHQILEPFMLRRQVRAGCWALGAGP